MTPRYYQELAIKRAGLDRFDQFRHLATDLADTDYAWGEESLRGVDCSGSVFMPFLMMGYSVRTTATELYRRLFVHPVRGHHEQYVAAAFVITAEDVQHNDRIEHAGGATHVMPVVGEQVVLDAAWDQEAKLKAFNVIEDRYVTRVAHIEYRALDWGRLRKLSEERTALFGVDPIVREMLAA